MQHVGLVEAVVAQFVVHYLVRREVTRTARTFYYIVSGKEQRCLGEAATVITVFGVADGTDREYDLRLWIELPQGVYGSLKSPGTLVDRQLALGKEPLRTLPAVVHYLARLAEDIHMVGAEREDRHVYPTLANGPVGNGALHRMENADGIVHYAVWIDQRAELVLGELTAYICRETRADEQQSVRWQDVEGCAIYLNMSE